MAGPIVCSCCEEPLGDEEAADPYRDEDGEVLCDECHHDHYEFTCCLCRNYGHVDDQHNFVVVFDAEAFERRAGLTPGVYRVKDAPYFGGPLIGGTSIFNGAVERVADVPAGAAGDGYPCGHLCLECQAKVVPPQPTEASDG